MGCSIPAFPGKSVPCRKCTDSGVPKRPFGNHFYLIGFSQKIDDKIGIIFYQVTGIALYLRKFQFQYMSKLYILVSRVSLTIFLFTAICFESFSQSASPAPTTAGGIATPNDFKAVPGNRFVDINWTTSFELNVERFDIEYSPDGNDYALAGSVLAKGGSENNNYHFEHNYLKPGNIYYRLKMVNYDGSYQYSNVIVTDYSGYSNYNFIYPSTVRRGYPVKFFTNEYFDRAEMISQSGSVLFKQNIKGMIGRFEIPATINSSGIYYVRLSNSDRFMIQKIMVTD